MHRILIAILIAAFTHTITASAQDGPKGATVLIIRHAEKPLIGSGLSSRGAERAKAYDRYFRAFSVNSKPLHIDKIYAAADSSESQRPRLTVAPLARAMSLQTDTSFGNNQLPQFAGEIRSRQKNKTVLICWRHHELPGLLRVLGADPESLLPDGKWPDDTYDWVIQLTYDKDGRLIPSGTKRISQHLLRSDSK